MTSFQAVFLLLSLKVLNRTYELSFFIIFNFFNYLSVGYIDYGHKEDIVTDGGGTI